MIVRWIVHVEAHRGYRPRFSIRRAPRAGDRVMNGDEACILEPCQVCSGDGFLAREIRPRGPEPSPDAEDDPDGSKGAAYFADLMARFGRCTCPKDMTASCEPSESECVLCARLDPDWPCPTSEHHGYPGEARP